MPVINRTFEQVKKSVINKGYRFFDRSVNLIGERTSDKFTNTFNDMLHCCYYDYSDNKNKIITIPWTTLAGTIGEGSESQPLTVGGLNVVTGKWEVVTGVAIWKEGQYQKVWKFVDSYVGWLKHPYLFQVAPCDVYRDGKVNELIDRDSPVHRGIFNLNGHRMSAEGTSTGFLSYIGSKPWSQGCQGAPTTEFDKLLTPIREDVKKFGDLFTYTLIKSSDIIS